MKVKLLVSLAGEGFDYACGAVADVKDGHLTENDCRGLMLHGSAEPADKEAKTLLEQALKEQGDEVEPVQTSGLKELAEAGIQQDVEDAEKAASTSGLKSL